MSSNRMIVNSMAWNDAAEEAKSPNMEGCRIFQGQIEAPARLTGFRFDRIILICKPPKWGMAVLMGYLEKGGEIVDWNGAKVDTKTFVRENAEDEGIVKDYKAGCQTCDEPHPYETKVWEEGQARDRKLEASIIEETAGAKLDLGETVASFAKVAGAKPDEDVDAHMDAIEETVEASAPGDDEVESDALTEGEIPY